MSVTVMCACLLLLTGVNFFYYPPGQDPATYTMTSEEAPQVPTEEKSSETKNLTQVQEEYLHDGHAAEAFWFNLASLHKIHQAEKLAKVPSDPLYSPPRA